jgi:signal peptidase I
MAPTFLSNERIIAAPVAYAIRLPFSQQRIIETGRPKRGDLVVIQPPYLEKENVVQRILNPFVQFFTLQQRRLFPDRMSRGAGNHLIKRIVGVPGDTIAVKELIAYIKPVNQPTFHRESDLIPFDYEISTDGFKTDWPKDLPFSGNTSEIELSDTEYFVLGDNRTSSSDSRSWGPIISDHIIAKVILRYWPLNKLGSP